MTMGDLDTADIVVVGGGVVGLSSAIELRKRGFDVVVVEQRFLAFGASGRNAGGIWLQLRRVGPELELARRGLQKYVEYEADLGPTFDLRRRGGLFFFETDAQQDVLQHYVADRQRAGLDVSMVSRAEAADLSTVLPDSAIGAVFCANDAQVDGGAFVRGLGNACLRMGVRIYTNTAVLGTIRKVDRVSGVRTVRGDVRAGAVVWATGPWAVTLQSEGVELPLETVRVGQLVTQPIGYSPGAVLHGPRGVSRCGALVDLPAFNEALFRPDDSSAAPGLEYDDTFAQNVEGSILVGSSIDGRGSLNPHISMVATRALLDATMDRTPRLGALGVTGLWAGLVAETPDHLPVIDQVEGLYVNVGHSYGMASGPAGGEIVARIVAGETDPLGDQLNIARGPRRVL
jgi:glycine/D-amino acid oxidase-like deaminating enzyme